MSIDTAASALDRRARRAERLLLPAGFLTTAGNAFQITAAAILVFRAEETTLSVGWLFIAVSIPQVVLAVLFGRLVDRYDRRWLSILADAVSAVTAFALPVWLWLGGGTSLGTYLANFLLAVTTALFIPASNALVKERVSDARIGTFNSHFEMATNSGMLLAASSAGFLITAFGATPLFIVNSLTFVASGLLTWAIGRRPQIAAGTAEAAEDAAPAPVATAPANPPIKRLAVMFTSGNVNLMVANTILTSVILYTFDAGAWMIGVVDALAGLGFIVGAGCYGWVSARIRPLNHALLGTLGCCAMLLIEPLHPYALMGVIPIAGFCFAQGRIAARTLLMRASPQERVGRIFGGAQAFGLALGVPATIGLSALADATSVPVAFWGLSLLIAVMVTGSYLSLRKPLADPPPQPVPVREDVLAPTPA